VGLAAANHSGRTHITEVSLSHQSFGKLCVLSRSEAADLEEEGLVPDCRSHRHLGRRAAESLAGTPAGGGCRAARVVTPPTGVKAKPAITFEFAPGWRPQTTLDPALRPLPGGPRFKSYQLVP
jgi:hypothetical protein